MPDRCCCCCCWAPFHLAAALLLLLLAFLPAAAVDASAGHQVQEEQQQSEVAPPLEYSVEVEVVQIPFTALDKKGQWVTGLTAGELELMVDGQPQQVLYIDEQEPEIIGHAKARSSEATEAGSDAPPAYQNHVIVIIDGNGSSAAALEKHKKRLRDMIANFQGAGTSFLVFVIRPGGSEEMVLEPTTDRAAAAQAIDTVQAGSDAGNEGRRVNVERMIMKSGIGSCSAAATALAERICIKGATRMMIRTASRYGEEERARFVQSAEAAADIIRMTSHFPGNRSVIFVSEAVDSSASFYFDYILNQMRGSCAEITRCFSPLAFEEIRKELQAEADRLRAGVDPFAEFRKIVATSGSTLYWIHPDIDTDPLDPGKMLTITHRYLAPEEEQVVSRLAEDTGGLALRRGRSSQFYDRVTRLLPRYYWIGYSPAGSAGAAGAATTAAAADHRIVLKSKRPGVVLNYAKAVKYQSRENKTEDLLALAHDFPRLGRWSPLRIDARFYRLNEGQYRVWVAAALPFQGIEPQPDAENLLWDDVHFSFAVAQVNGKQVSHEHKIVSLDLMPQQLALYRDNGVLLDYNHVTVAPPGSYAITAAAVEEGKRKPSVGESLLTLPGGTESCTTLSSILDAGSFDASFPANEGQDETGVIRGDRSFHFSLVPAVAAGGSLDGLFQLIGGSSPPPGEDAGPPSIVYRIYDAAGKLLLDVAPAARTQEILPAEKDAAWRDVSFSVPLRGLRPGDYELEISLQPQQPRCEPTSRRLVFRIVDRLPDGASAPSGL